MEGRFHLHLPEFVWYECAICGHRAEPRGGQFVTPEDETEPRPPRTI